jgi:hypothetical protein
MTREKANLIRLLEAELDLIEGGGLGQPAGRPGTERPVFDHSLVCINHWLVPDHESECHEDCILLDGVPERHRGEKQPCHFIPLNAAGETVKSLEDKGDRERLEEEVKKWLRTTIQRLRADEDFASPEDVKY